MRFSGITAFAVLTLTSCIATPPMHQHHGFDYIELTVSDMARAQEFYGAAFGWEFTEYGADYAGIRIADKEVGGLAVGTRPPGGPLVILYSRDLEASVAAVRRAGGTISIEPFEFPGGRRFHFLDPNGNELAVWTED